MLDFCTLLEKLDYLNNSSCVTWLNTISTCICVWLKTSETDECVFAELHLEVAALQCTSVSVSLEDLVVGVQVEGRRERADVCYPAGFGEDGRGGEEDELGHVSVWGSLRFCILRLWGWTGLIFSMGFLLFLSESNHLLGSYSRVSW